MCVVAADDNTRSSPPGNRAAKALERRFRREPSGKVVGSPETPEISRSRESNWEDEKVNKVLDEFSRTSKKEFSDLKSITRSIFFFLIFRRVR